MEISRDQPTLWHIAISHYSEKTRWALEYKSVAHERRTAPPGLHIVVALWLSNFVLAVLSGFVWPSVMKH